MKRIFVPTRDGSDWQRLLAKPELHWKPGASAMTTAAAWEDANDRLPPEIRSSLTSTGLPALQDLSLLAAIPEWEVALPGGEYDIAYRRPRPLPERGRPLRRGG